MNCCISSLLHRHKLYKLNLQYGKIFQTSISLQLRSSFFINYLNDFTKSELQMLHIQQFRKISISIMGCVESQTRASAPIRLQTHIRPRSQASKKSSKTEPYVSRLSSKFKIEDIKEISQQQKRGGVKPCYTCPICFLFYNKILACTACQNCICFSCFNSHEKKWRRKTKCPFCFSNTNLFIDYELEAHSYFDTTGQGFISREERERIDQQILDKIAKNKSSKSIQTIKETQQN